MSQLRRPPSVTMAVVFVGLTSLIVFFSLTSALSDWGSIELQDGVRDALDDPALKGMDLTVPEVIEWLRLAAYVAVFLSIAGIVLAVFTARGHRPSRISLTVMCGLAFLGFVLVGGIAGLFPAALAVVCAVQLWSSDSSAWFNAKNGVAAPRTPSVPPVPLAAAPDPVGAISVADPQAPGRPKAVRVAGLVTLIASWLVLMLSAYFTLIYTTARESYIESISKGSTKRMLDDYDILPADLVDWMFIFFAVCGVLAILACAAAVLLLTGKRFGRAATMVFAGAAVPLSFLFVGVGWPWTAAAVFVLVKLSRPEARTAS
ncbi:MAG: hypothetical protein ABIN55_01365 [Aeromicrobium sp.]